MRIAITGAGWISPVMASWDNLKAPPLEAPLGIAEDWFCPDRELGKRGHRHLSAPTKYLLVAASRAIGLAGDISGVKPHKRGMLIGTNLADFWVRKAFDRVVLTEGAGGLSAMEAPNSAVNMPAGYAAVTYGYRGLNMTLTNPDVSGFESLHYARQFLWDGLLDFALCGATDEFLLTQRNGESVLLGGACAFTLERAEEARGRASRVLVEITDSALAFVGSKKSGGKRWRQRLAHTLRSLCGQSAGNVWVLSSCMDTAHDVCHLLGDNGVTADSLAGTNEAYCADYSILPLFQLLSLIANKRQGTVLAINSHGHIVSLNISLGGQNV